MRSQSKLLRYRCLLGSSHASNDSADRVCASDCEERQRKCHIYRIDLVLFPSNDCSVAGNEPACQRQTARVHCRTFVCFALSPPLPYLEKRQKRDGRWHIKSCKPKANLGIAAKGFKRPISRFEFMVWRSSA